MKFIAAIISLFLIPLTAGCARTESSEFRAVWVHNWRSGLLCPSEIDETVRWAKDCNMNVVIAQVRKTGDAYYNSAYEPRATNITSGPEFDPLDYLIKTAQSNGLEVHSWFNVYRVLTATPPPSGHIAAVHPDWLSKDYDGKTISNDGQFLDPGVPEVREYLIKVISDLVSKYPISGITLDFIRYPGRKWGYNDIAIARFNSEYGRTGKPSPDDKDWCDWRRKQVTETVREIYRTVNSLKPNIKICAATISWGNCPSDFSKTDAYHYLFQDWRSWMEQGIIDANMPMSYYDPSTAKDRQRFTDWVRGAKRWSYGRHVYCGLMIFKDNVSGTASQIRLARNNGLDGIVGFAFSQADCKDALASKLKCTVFPSSAPIPEMSWKLPLAQKD